MSLLLLFSGGISAAPPRQGGSGAARRNREALQAKLKARLKAIQEVEKEKEAPEVVLKAKGFDTEEFALIAARVAKSVEAVAEAHAHAAIVTAMRADDVKAQALLKVAQEEEKAAALAMEEFDIAYVSLVLAEA